MKYFSIIIIGIVLLFNSCKKASESGNCSNKLNAGIISVSNTALTAAINQDINFELLYGVSNGCGISSTIETTKEGNNTIVNVMTQYEGCVCTQIYKEERKMYTFKSAVAGNFKLKFNKGDGNFIERNVVIQ